MGYGEEARGAVALLGCCFFGRKRGMQSDMFSLTVMGCRLNHAEAAAIRGVLESEGFVREESKPRKGVPYLLHTCAVTAVAQTEALRHLRSAKRAGAMPVLVSGCAANVTEPERLFEAGADAIIYRVEKPEATGWARGEWAVRQGESASEEAKRLAEKVAEGFQFQFQTGIFPRHTSTRAPVKIQDGCSFRCSYCIVPDARGNPRSRALADVLEECRGLARRGFRELVLTGVNVACWRDGSHGFADVVRAVSALDGVARVRISSVEPHTGEEEVLSLLSASDTKLCRTLHYPMQSGSDKVLKLMRRRYDSAAYRRVLDRILERVPDIGLGTDIITGFPGEDEAAFEETVRLVRDYPFSNLHVFPYSERAGTPAAEYPDKVPMQERRARAKVLLALGEEKRAAFAATFAGKTVEVLIERVDGEGTATGWSSEYLPVRISGCTSERTGQLVRVKVARIAGETVFGSMDGLV